MLLFLVLNKPYRAHCFVSANVYVRVNSSREHPDLANPQAFKKNSQITVNCIKQVTKWINPTEQRQSKCFYCFCRSFMVHECPSYSKWRCLKPLTLSTSEMTTGCYEASFLLFANARRAILLAAKCLVPGDSSCIKCTGFARGSCSLLELTPTLVVHLQFYVPFVFCAWSRPMNKRNREQKHITKKLASSIISLAL